MHKLFKKLSFVTFLIALSSSHAFIIEGEKCKKLCTILAEMDCAEDALCNYITKMEMKLNCDMTVCRRLNENSKNWKQRFEEGKGSADVQDRILNRLLKGSRHNPYNIELGSKGNTIPEEEILIVIRNDNEDYKYGTEDRVDEDNIMENYRKLNFFNFIAEFINLLRENSKRKNFRMTSDADDYIHRQLESYFVNNNMDHLKEVLYTRKIRRSLIDGTNSMFDFKGRLAGHSEGEIESSLQYGPEGLAGKLHGNIGYSGEIKGTGAVNMGNLQLNGLYEGGINGGGQIDLEGRLNGQNSGFEGGWSHGANANLAGLVKANYLGVKVGSMAGTVQANYTRDVDVNGGLDDDGKFRGELQSDTKAGISGTSIFGIGYQDYGIGGMIKGEGAAELKGKIDLSSVNGDWNGEGKHVYTAGGELEAGGGLADLSEVERQQQMLLASRNDP